MANISALLEIIRTAHLGRDMRQALHDAIESVNNDTETALGKSLTFTTATRKLSLKAKDGTVLSEAVIPGGGSGGGSVDSVNEIFPDENGNVEVNLNDINDVDITSATDGQLLGYDNASGKWRNVNAPSGGGGHTIKNESGTALTQRDNLQFKGCAVSDDSTNNATVVSVQTSNRNLLDNAWFTVNQKGWTTGTVQGNTSKPIFDMWWATYGGGDDALGTITLNSDHSVTLHANVTSGRNGRIFIKQKFEDDIKTALGTHSKTVSILLSDGRILTKTIGSGYNYFVEDFDVASDTYLRASLYCRTTDIPATLDIGIGSKEAGGTATDITIKAVKLELGTESTLALDTAPSYTEELLKCQRYFYPLKGFSTFGKLAVNTNNRYFVIVGITLPAEMRVIPTLSGTCYGYDVSNHNGALSDLAVSGKQSITVSGIFPSGASLKTGLGEFEFRDAYLSAEL